MLPVILVLALGAGGCTRAAYVNKVTEAENLSRYLAELQQRYQTLEAENTTLKVRHANLLNEAARALNEKDRMASNLAAATAERDKSADDNKELRKVLKERTDSLSAKITDLGRKTSELESENDILKRKLVQIQKGHEEKVENLMRTYEGWMEQMKPEIGRGQAKVTVSESAGTVTINLVGSILFESGEVEINPEGQAVLQKIIPGLKNAKGQSVRVEGHTDEFPPGKLMAQKYPTNWELSAARAVNVTRYLVENGIDPANLFAAAYGEHRPVADNSTPEGRAKNRRIEIILVPRQ